MVHFKNTWLTIKFYIQNLCFVFTAAQYVPPPRRTYVCTIKLIKLKDNSVMLYTGNQMKLSKPLSLTVRVSIVTGERLQN